MIDARDLVSTTKMVGSQVCLSALHPIGVLFCVLCVFCVLCLGVWLNRAFWANPLTEEETAGKLVIGVPKG